MTMTSQTTSSRFNALLFKTSQLQRLIRDARRETKPNQLRLLRLQSLKLAVQQQLFDLVPQGFGATPVLIPATNNSLKTRRALHVVR